MSVRTTSLSWVCALSLCFSLAAPVPAQQSSSGPAAARSRAKSFEFPVCLVENRGVYPAPVEYFVRGAAKTIYFTPQGVTTRLIGDQRDWVIRQCFVGPSPGTRPVGADKLEARFHYFTGKPDNWRTGLHAYERVVYRNLWPGIDHVYRVARDQLKYDFVIRAGADPGRIRVAIRGADTVRVGRDGALVIETPVGTLTDSAPVAWQVANGRRSPVPVAFRVRLADSGDSYEVSYEVGRYDPARTLVIDPAILVYCGFVGGFDDDWLTGVAVDAQGHAHITGFTKSDEKSFPLRGGPVLKHGGTTYNDAFVAKLRADGSGFVYCGFIGGYWEDRSEAIAVDAGGNAYIGGHTNSDETTFPVLTGPSLKRVANGDAFVAKIGPTGKLIYCGFIGGAFGDIIRSIATDAAGAAYVAGDTQSNEASFPVTVGPDLTKNSGYYDTFVAKVNPSGKSLDYCGYIAGKERQYCTGIAVDAKSRAYVVGFTQSDQGSFPVTVGPDLTFNASGSTYDAFVARVAADGKTLEYCGYIGGDGDDRAEDVAVDGAGAAYVTGVSSSSPTSFPRRIGPFLQYQGRGGVYVAKVNSTGKAIDYCGYISGAGNDNAKAIAVDSAGAAYVVGGTTSDENSFPVKGGPDLTRNGRSSSDPDGYVAKVKPSATGLDFCGYIGGAWATWAVDIAVDPAGNAYLVGLTRSTEKSFPVKGGPILQWVGKADSWVAKVAHTVIDGPNQAKVGTSVGLALTSSDSAGLAYRAGSSLGRGPIPIDQRKLHLTPDALLRISTYDEWPTIFRNYGGTLDAAGRGAAKMNVPNLPLLIGQTIHTAFVTVDPTAPSGLRSISDTASVLLTR